MALFIDTPFGFLMRNITGGRVFKYADYYDDDLRERYLNSGDIQKEESSSDEEKNESKGSFQMIEFLENDPAVSHDDIALCKHHV
jgi:DHA1 family multidrug resistance protein-like MFS transporter